MVALRRRTWCTGLLSLCLALTCLCLVIVAIVVVKEYPVLRQHQVEQKVTILPGHATYEQLKEPMLPIWKSVYFFNLTNPKGFAEGETPVVKEIGPYAYREHRTKKLGLLNEDSTKLNYTQQEYFEYDPSASGEGLSETDWICTINLPLVGAVAMVNGLPEGLERYFGIILLKGIFEDVNATLYLCDEATNLAWNFTNDLVHELHTNDVLVALNLSYPTDWVSLQRNNSVNDSIPSIIRTGVGNIDGIGEYVQWNGHKELDIWANGTGANDINGTEGLFFHPNIDKSDQLQVFIADAVRSFPLEWNTTVDPLGLTAYRYKLPLSVYKSAFTNPENARWFSWCPDGLFYIGVSQWPVVPVFGSKPHFLDGDPILREKVLGLHPNRSLHETVVDVEPITGVTVQAKKQFQINLQVNQSSMFNQLQHVNGTLYYPILYVNENSLLTPEFKSYLESHGLSLVYLLDWLIWLIFVLLLLLALVSGLCAAFALGLFLRRVRQSTQNEVAQSPLLT